MIINVNIDLPPHVENVLRSHSQDLAFEVREAFAVELFRRGLLDHYTLSQVLGIDRYDTDAVLVRHQVFEGGLTMADIEEDRKNLDAFFGKNV